MEETLTGTRLESSDSSALGSEDHLKVSGDCLPLPKEDATTLY